MRPRPVDNITLSSALFQDRDMALGTGLDMTSYSRKGRLINTPISEGERPSAGNKHDVHTTEYYESRTEVNKALKLKFELEAKIINPLINTDVGSTFGYETEFIADRHVIYYLVYDKYVLTKDEIDIRSIYTSHPDHVIPEAQPISNNMQTQEADVQSINRFRQFGNFYLERKYYGGIFLFICEIECQNEEQKNDVKTSLTANVGSVSIISSLERISKWQETVKAVHTKRYCLGGGGGLPAIDGTLSEENIQQINQYRTTFAQNLVTQTNQAVVHLDFAPTELFWGGHFSRWIKETYNPRTRPIIDLIDYYYEIEYDITSLQLLLGEVLLMVGGMHPLPAYLRELTNTVVGKRAVVTRYLTNSDFLDHAFDWTEDFRPNTYGHCLEKLFNRIQSKKYIEYNSSKIQLFYSTDQERICHDSWLWGSMQYPLKSQNSSATFVLHSASNAAVPSQFLCSGDSVRLHLEGYSKSHIGQNQYFLTVNGSKPYFAPIPPITDLNCIWRIQTDQPPHILQDGSNVLLSSIRKADYSLGCNNDVKWVTLTNTGDRRVPLRLKVVPPRNTKDSRGLNESIMTLQQSLSSTHTLFASINPDFVGQERATTPPALAEAIRRLPGDPTVGAQEAEVERARRNFRI